MTDAPVDSTGVFNLVVGFGFRNFDSRAYHS